MTRIQTISCSILFSIAALTAFSEEEMEAPRNPFWPQGYEGPRQPIAETPRFKPKPKENVPSKNGTSTKKKPTKMRVKTEAEAKADAARAKAAAERKAVEAEKAAAEKRWADAMKTLKFGPAAHFTRAGVTHDTITIDGRIYRVGDRVSRTVGEWRFTWQVRSVSREGKLRLDRVQQKPLTNTKKK